MKKLLLGLLFLLCITVVVITLKNKITGLYNKDIFSGMSKKEILDSFGKYTGVKFPRSSNLLNYYAESWMEVYILLKVEIDEEDLDYFKKTLPFPSGELTGKLVHIPGASTKLKWWDPDIEKRYLSGTGRTLDGGKVNLLISFVENENIIYIEWMGTEFH